MAISHLSVLNHLSSLQNEKTPMQLAKSFHVTKGAMTNTLSKLEASGYIDIRPDLNDARKKTYEVVDKINWENEFHRKDIAKKYTHSFD